MGSFSKAVIMKSLILFIIPILIFLIFMIEEIKSETQFAEFTDHQPELTNYVMRAAKSKERKANLNCKKKPFDKRCFLKRINQFNKQIRKNFKKLNQINRGLKNVRIMFQNMTNLIMNLQETIQNPMTTTTTETATTTIM